MDECDLLEATIHDQEAAALAVAEETKRRAQREANFLTRKRKREEQAAWRPEKRHRKASFQWVIFVDHQLKTSTCYGGLVGFAVPAALELRGHWSSWPHLTLVTDQGSPEMCGLNFLQQRCRLCVDDISDFGHGVHRDLGLALRRSELWDHVLLHMALWNVPHGPWCEDVRAKEVQGVWKSFFARYARPQDSPLFMELLPWILWESGDQSSSSEVEVAERYWEQLKHCDPFEKKGSKTNLNRFLSYAIKGESEAPLHSVRLLGYLSCCLEQDYLGSSKMCRLLCDGKGTKKEGGRESTSASRTDIVDSALAKAALNQLAVGTLVLLDRPGQIIERGIQRVASAVRLWYGEMSREVRSVWKGASWLMCQLRGEFMSSLFGILKVLGKPADLAWIGIKLPSLANLPADPDLRQALCMEQDELVQTIATFGMNLVGCRLIRCAYITHGFSCRSILWRHGDEAVVQEELAKFKRAYDLDEKLRREHLENPGAEDLLASSQFRLVVVEQLAEALKEQNFGEVTAKLDQFLERKHNRLLTSEVVENSFNRQKRMKARDTNRRLDLRRAWGVLLDRQVLDQVNDFQPVRFAGTQPTRSVTLPPAVQEPPLSGCSIDEASKLSSHKAKMDWYSPGASKHSLKYLTQVVMDYADKHSLWGSLDKVWLNCFFRASHSLMLREIGDRQSAYFALQDLSGCCAAVWPAIEVTRPSGAAELGDLVYFEPKPNPEVEECFVVALAAERWEALWVQWRSPAWQVANLKQDAPQGFAVRAFGRPGAEWAPMLEVGARAAFWDLPLTTLKAIADYRGVVVEPKASLFSVLTAIVGGILDCDEVEVLDICRQRLAKMSHSASNSMSDVILELDEGQSFLDTDEKRELLSAKKRVGEATKDVSAFKDEYSVRRKACPAPARKGCASRRGPGVGTPRVSRYPPVPRGMMTQQQAKALLPPGATIWRGLSNGTWNSHLAPFPRKGFQWCVYGENESCLMCIRHVWELYLEGEGKHVSDCPVQGLFPSTAANAPGRKSSSSGGS